MEPGRTFTRPVQLSRLENQFPGSGGDPVYSQEAIIDYLTNGSLSIFAKGD